VAPASVPPDTPCVGRGQDAEVAELVGTTPDDYHLLKIFAKLGITARKQLRR
jgi:hypothetical protein